MASHPEGSLGAEQAERFNEGPVSPKACTVGPETGRSQVGDHELSHCTGGKSYSTHIPIAVNSGRNVIFVRVRSKKPGAGSQNFSVVS